MRRDRAVEIVILSVCHTVPQSLTNSIFRSAFCNCYINMRRSPAWILARAVVIILLSGLAGATLVRFAPGFGIDERVLDPRFSTQTLESIQKQHAPERNPLAF